MGLLSLGIRIPPCESLVAVAEAAKMAESAGYDMVWIPDSQALWRDVWASCAVVAARTSRIGIGTGVTNPVTRDVTVSASAAISIQELSEGRFTLGIGTGDSAARAAGIPPATRAEMLKYVHTMRRLTSVTSMRAGDTSGWASATTRSDVPIYIAAGGPRMLELAGAIGDGIMLTPSIGALLPSAFDYIRRGMVRTGRSIEALRVVVGYISYIGADWRREMKQVQPHAAIDAIRRRDSIPGAATWIPEGASLHFEGGDLAHARDWARAIEATDWLPDEILESYVLSNCLFGTASDMARKLSELASLGVTDVYIRDARSFTLPVELLRRFGSDVMPLMA